MRKATLRLHLGRESRPEDASVHRALGLSDDEYQRIYELLERHPNHLELAMYSVMWSEHCSYKSSKFISSDSPRKPHGFW